MSKEHEERQRALEYAIACSMERVDGKEESRYTDASVSRRELLRSCVAIPKAEYDMLRRALWCLMRWRNAENTVSVANDATEVLREAGLVGGVKGDPMGDWITEACYDIAEERRHD